MRLGKVYFVQALGGERPIKIGWAAQHPQSRIDQWRAGCPYPIQLLGLIPGPSQMERDLHALFSKWKLPDVREWFYPVDIIVKLATCQNAIDAAGWLISHRGQYCMAHALAAIGDPTMMRRALERAIERAAAGQPAEPDFVLALADDE